MGLIATEFGKQMKVVKSPISDLKKEIISLARANVHATPLERQIKAVQALQYDENFIGNYMVPTGGPGNQ